MPRNRKYDLRDALSILYEAFTEPIRRRGRPRKFRVGLAAMHPEGPVMPQAPAPEREKPADAATEAQKALQEYLAEKSGEVKSHYWQDAMREERQQEKERAKQRMKEDLGSMYPEKLPRGFGRAQEHQPDALSETLHEELTAKTIEAEHKEKMRSPQMLSLDQAPPPKGPPASEAVIEAEYKVIEEKEGPVREEEKQEKTPEAPEAEKAFGEFSVSPEDLRTIKGFETCSDIQKQFIFRNMQQLAYSNIEAKAFTAQQVDTASLGRLRQVGRAFFEGFAGKGGKLAKREVEALEAIRKGGIKEYGGTLQMLTDLTKDAEVVKNADTNQFEVNYVHSQQFGPEHADTIKAFNEAARAFAETPQDWGSERASKKEQRQFKETKDTYESAHAVLAELANKKLNHGQAIEFLSNRDKHVHLNRTLNECPELEETLKNAASIGSKGYWTKAFSAIKATGEKIGLAGTGGAIRYIGTGILGYSALPVAMAGAGAIKATREAFRARRTTATEREAAQEGLTREEKAKVSGVYGKTDFVDAVNLNERLGKLIEKINDPAHEKKALSVKQLDRLVQLSEQSLDAKRINFGKEGTRFANEYNFITNLSRARAELAVAGYRDKESIIHNITYFDTEGATHKISLDEAMEARGEKMSAERRQYIRQQAGKGFLVGATFGAIGATVAGWVKDAYGEEVAGAVSKIREVAGRALGTTKEKLGEFAEVDIGKTAGAVVEEAKKQVGGFAEAARDRAEALSRAIQEKGVLGAVKERAEEFTSASKETPPPPKGLPVAPEGGKTPLREAIDKAMARAEKAVKGMTESVERTTKTVEKAGEHLRAVGGEASKGTAAGVPTPEGPPSVEPKIKGPSIPEKEIPYDWRERVELPPKPKAEEVLPAEEMPRAATTPEEETAKLKRAGARVSHIPEEGVSREAPSMPKETEPARPPAPETSAVYSGALKGAEAAAELAPDRFAAEAGKGDNLWNIIEGKLGDKNAMGEEFAEKFNRLPEGKKVLFTDAVKDYVGEHKGDFGLKDIDKIQAGQKIDLAPILDNEEKMLELITKTEGTNKDITESIEKQTVEVEKWVKSHPTETLTEQKFDEILNIKEKLQQEKLIVFEQNARRQFGLSVQEYEKVENTKINTLFKEAAKSPNTKEAKLARFIESYTNRGNRATIEQMTVKQFWKFFNTFVTKKQA